MAQVKRETANICLIRDILNGNFVKAEGWNPSYFSTELGNISRVNILGVLVAREAEGLVLDDGSGRIFLRSFEEGTFAGLDVGDFVTVIGRPRMYNEQKYIMPEIIKKTDLAWFDLRKLQISCLKRTPLTPIKESRVAVSEPTTTTNYFAKVIDLIRDIDHGEGADAEEVSKRSGIPEAGEVIRRLIEGGEIFELKPGRLKVLE